MYGSKMPISIIVIVTISSTSMADIFGFKKKFTHNSSPDYRELVLHLQGRASAADEGLGKPFLRPIVDRILEPNAVEISFRHRMENTGKESQTIASGKIYISRGKLFVCHRVINDELYSRRFASSEHSPEDDSLMNYATINGSLYQWRVLYSNGKGKRLQRYPGDTISLLMYLIDPGALMKFLYGDYIHSIENKGDESIPHRELQDNKIEIMSKDPDNRLYMGARVAEDPPWFHAAIFPWDLEGKERNSFYIYEIDYPKVIEHIPESVKGLPENIEFEESSLTAESVMVYL